MITKQKNERMFRARPGMFDDLIDRMDISMEALKQEDENEQEDVDLWGCCESDEEDD